MKQAIESIYNHIMGNGIIKKDRYDIISINNYYRFHNDLDIYATNMLNRLVMKYGKELCIDSIQT